MLQRPNYQQIHIGYLERSLCIKDRSGEPGSVGSSIKEVRYNIYQNVMKF
jgi:hypothetical protein